jgi:predicted ATPase
MHRAWDAPEWAQVRARARELASMLNRPRALCSALWGHFIGHWAQADLHPAHRVAKELQELGDATGDVVVQVMGCHLDGTICFEFGDLAAGRAILEEALALYDPAQRPSYAELVPYDQLVVMRSHFSWALAILGHLDQALVQQDAALGEARRLSHPPTLAIALAGTGLLCLCWGPGLQLQYADELLVLATEHGLEFFRMWALIGRGWSLAGMGRADEGVALLAVGLAGLRDHGFVIVRPWALTLLADACRMAGQWRAALTHLAEARGLAEENEVRWLQAETLRLTGDVLLATGDAAAAEASYREALAIAKRQSAKVLELRAATSLARLWCDQGKYAEPRNLLSPIYGWFTEGLDTPVLQEAKTLLDQLT